MSESPVFLRQKGMDVEGDLEGDTNRTGDDSPQRRRSFIGLVIAERLMVC